MKRRAIIALVLCSAYANPEPSHKWWVFQGFGVDMVQCELASRVTHCHFVNGATLDGIMEAVHRATKAEVKGRNGNE